MCQQESYHAKIEATSTSQFGAAMHKTVISYCAPRPDGWKTFRTSWGFGILPNHKSISEEPAIGHGLGSEWLATNLSQLATVLCFFDLFEDLEHLPAGTESIDTTLLKALIVKFDKLLPFQVFQVVGVLVQTETS